MRAGPYSHLAKGTFLVASPDITEGIYARSVILLCEHSMSGSFGLIINKMLDVALPEEVLSVKEMVNPNVEIRSGGPIQPNQMMLLHSHVALAGQVLEICDGVYLGGDVQFLQESIADKNGPHIRLCFGYAGWEAGQLEKEFLSGNWFLHPASANIVFSTPHEKIWQTVLREMGGKYATFSMIPEDLRLN